MTESKVTVIITLLNEAPVLPRLLFSLTSQLTQPAEIIIIDGGSNDGSWEVLQTALKEYKILIPVRDETCSLKYSQGPIARGRNQAIRRASHDIIVCADAGCIYGPQWLGNLIEPIVSNRADFCIGGSCVEKESTTLWDVACAPFIGFDLPGEHMPKTPTGTARSFAMRKQVWEDLGGYPECSLTGEDTAFLLAARLKFREAFAPNARAYYIPKYNLMSALRRLARYACADGLMNLAPRRFIVMMLRVALGLTAIVFYRKSTIPILAFGGIELFFSLRFDFVGLFRDGYIYAVPSRILFSLMVPLIFTINYFKGFVFNKNQTNEQNT